MNSGRAATVTCSPADAAAHARVDLTIRIGELFASMHQPRVIDHDEIAWAPWQLLAQRCRDLLDVVEHVLRQLRIVLEANQRILPSERLLLPVLDQDAVDEGLGGAEA